MGIPKLSRQGILPKGVHRAKLAEVRTAFGGTTARRVELMLAFEAALRRGWKAGVRRALVAGSFVTSEREPRDLDLLVRVDEDFARRLDRRDRDARWIADLAKARHPKTIDLFVAIDEEEWTSWIRLFEQDVWFGRKGVVEVVR